VIREALKATTALARKREAAWLGPQHADAKLKELGMEDVC